MAQLLEMMDKIDLDRSGVRHKLESEIERHQKFQAMLGVEEDKIQLRDIDLRNYAKHTLKYGTTEEKRQILTHLKNRIILKDKILTIE